MTVETPTRVEAHDDPEALIEEAWQRTRKRRRVRAVIAVTVALVVVIGAVVSRGDTGGHGVGGRGSAAAAGVRGSASGVRFWYTRTVFGSGTPSGLRGETTEDWVGTDGSWRQRVTDPADPAQEADMTAGGDDLFPPQANATADIDGAVTNVRDPGDGLFTARELQSLPADPIRLGALLERAVAAQISRNLNAYVGPGPRHHAGVARLQATFDRNNTLPQMLDTISTLYASPIPARIRAALYATTRGMPGIQVKPGAIDALGRRGVALDAGAFQLIFDPHTGALLSGTSGTLVAEGPVTSINAIPAGTRPVRGPAVAEMRPVHVTPAIGRAHTAFTLELPAPAGASGTRSAALPNAFIFGPTGPNCSFWASRSPIARIPPGTASLREGVLTDAYTLTPAAINRSSWCPGRYQIMLSLFPADGTLAQIRSASRSFTAAYFDTH
jgi:hypothetical protein